MIDLASGRTISKVVKTEIFFRKLSEAEIEKYLNQDPNYTTYAVGYDPLGHYSSTFVRKIEGSYNNLIRGVPLETVVEMLRELGAEP